MNCMGIAFIELKSELPTQINLLCLKIWPIDIIEVYKNSYMNCLITIEKKTLKLGKNCIRNMEKKKSKKKKYHSIMSLRGKF